MLQPLHTAAACGTVHQQYRASDAEVAQARCAHGRASTLAPSRREGCGEGWFSGTFAFVTQVYDMISKIRARPPVRLNEPDTALAAHAALRPTCVREVFL